MDELLINFGGSIKSLETRGDLVTVGDYGILWGSEKNCDLGGDWFTRDTFFGARKGLGVDCLLHHGLPLSPKLKSYTSILLPATIKAEPDDHGLLVATILDRRDAYQRKIYELTEEDALNWSSGAITRAVRRRDGVKAGEIVQWPIMEFSFTPTPAEFRMTGIRELDAIKSVSLDWFDAPSYAKAVRVLTDLKSAGPFQFCSTQCNLSDAEAEKVRAWGTANIPDDILAEDGREDTPHITVLYGLTGEDASEVAARTERFGAIAATVGEVDCFEGEEFDVVILRVESSDLQRLHTTLATLDHTTTHRTYQPHITLAYVQPGQGARFKGRTGPLAGETLTFGGFVFSDKQGDVTPVSTTGQEGKAWEEGKHPRRPDGKFGTGGGGGQSAGGKGKGDKGKEGSQGGDDAKDTQAEKGTSTTKKHVDAGVKAAIELMSGRASADEKKSLIRTIALSAWKALRASQKTLQATHGKSGTSDKDKKREAMHKHVNQLLQEVIDATHPDKDHGGIDTKKLHSVLETAQKVLHNFIGEGGSEKSIDAVNGEDEVKGLFAFDGISACSAAIREAADRLVYQVIYEVLSPSSAPVTVGLSTITTATPQERLEFLSDAADEFGEFVVNMVSLIMDMQGTETPEEAAKSLRTDLNFSEPLGSLEGLKFVDHSDKVLAALEDFYERVGDIVSLRSNSRKAGRVLSQANFDRLSTHRSRMTELLTELNDLLDQNAPDTVSDTEPPAPESKAVDAELLEAELRFRQMEFEMAAALD